MDTNNITSILDAITKANEAVKQVPELEAQIVAYKAQWERDADTIDTLSERIHTQQSTLTDRAETIARLEKELSEARFREQAAREASEKSIGTLRDIMEFANLALPVPAKPEVVEEAPKPEPVPVPLADTDGEASGEVTNSEPAPSMEQSVSAGEPEPEYEGQPYSTKPFWISDTEWELRRFT